jgi:hypothetical protein
MFWSLLSVAGCWWVNSGAIGPKTFMRANNDCPCQLWDEIRGGLWVSHDVLFTFLKLRVEVLELGDERALVRKQTSDESDESPYKLHEFGDCGWQRRGRFALMLPDRSFVGCLFKEGIILVFAFLVGKAAHTDFQEAQAVMASIVVGSRFKVVIDDVVKQRAVPEMLECWDGFCYVLKKCVVPFPLMACQSAASAASGLVRGGVDPPKSSR